MSPWWVYFLAGFSFGYALCFGVDMLIHSVVRRR